MAHHDDKIKHVEISLIQVPLKNAVSDAKVLTGRQKPLAHVALLVAEIETVNGARGFGFSYTLRAGSAAIFAHAQELASFLIDEDPNDIGRLWEKLAWQGASIGRGGLAVQAIAAFDTALWDLKAKRVDLSIGKFLGCYRTAIPCYNTSGGYLNATLDEVLRNVDISLEKGLGGIKLKVGQPDLSKDIERVRAVRKHVGENVPIMVDANQQWDYTTALRAGHQLDEFNLVWLEEPVSAYDYAGHARLSEKLKTPIATGEMLSSVAEVQNLVEHRSVTFLQPDVPRVGGFTPFLKIMAQAESHRLKLAPHFVMEQHVHVAAAFLNETWVEHIEWLEPAFNERLEIKDGMMYLPTRPGVGFSLSEQSREWRVAHARI
jgi:L-talarate/galactarate dehydratase